ncbi:MAG: NAD(P)H-hydrate dehydratase [Candidatus Diapherotrites archaeon]|nr:NAD(P)H-hydrate dehydratase [Candidatus Diapherotrites archaeon]
MDAITFGKVLDTNARYYGISPLQLMESAGRSIAEQLTKDFGNGNSIAIFCGTGNNGGDGFVAARYLADKNNVSVHLIGKPEQIKSSEAYRNFLILKNSLIETHAYADSKELPKKIEADIILECLIGTGIQGEIREPIKSVVELLNKSKAKKVSVDLPCPGFRPNAIYSLATKKVDNGVVLDIGIPKQLYYFTGPGNVKFLKKRNPESHKGENGVVLIVAGSNQYHGASIFAGKAASLFTDLIYFLTEKENIAYVKKASPEFIVSEISLKNFEKLAQKADSILIGPGLSISAKNKRILSYALKNFSEKKFVLDATALRLLNKKLLNKNCLLTPHANEFKALFPCDAKPENVLAMAKKHSCNILLKGSVDVISDGSALYYNFSGNALLTAGGTGDCLAGVAAAFSAKNSLLDSALAASFLVGFAADMLALKKSGLNASTLIESLPEAKKFCEEF